MKLLKYLDKTILIITIVLLAIGTIMIFSASNVSVYMKNTNLSPYYYLERQLVILGVSLVATISFLLINVKTTSKLSSLVIYSITILLFLLFVFGKISNHAQSWFDLGKYNMQPSEFLKVFMIIWVAKYYDLKEKKLDNYTIALYPALVILVAFMAIFFQPDLGTALIVLFIFAFMFLLSPIAKGIKVKISLIALAFAFLGFLILFGFGDKILSETQLQRIRSVGSNPCSEENYYTDGNQLCNGYIAINNGGLTGKGLGKSIQKYLYLPEAHTDFIFCIIIEELGVLFGIFIIILYMVLLGKIVHLGKRATTNRDALICFGGAFYIFIHIMVNLLGVFGIIPMTGVPLPFMSYGGSYLLSLSIMLAVIQRISFETRLKEEAAKGKK